MNIESEGLGRVRSFSLKTGGDVYDIAIDPRRNYSFSPDHLSDHLRSGAPVKVRLGRRNGLLYAKQISDA